MEWSIFQVVVDKTSRMRIYALNNVEQYLRPFSNFTKQILAALHPVHLCHVRYTAHPYIIPGRGWEIIPQEDIMQSILLCGRTE